MTVITPWGSIGYLVFKRTYARYIESENRTEEFPETIDRVLRATVTQLGVNWDEGEYELARRLMLQLKGSVAGRFLWQLGTGTVERLGLASLQNCAACIVDDPIRPFTWTFDMLMLGSGVGFNIQLKHVYGLPEVKHVNITANRDKDADFIVPDSREGWVALLDRVLRAHFYDGKDFSFSTLLIRSKGAPIKTFGGTASGDIELIDGILKINKVLNARAGQKIRPIDALDIMNLIGGIVVAGNVRRSAQIAIGDHIDKLYMQSKRWDLGNVPNHRAMSNNSVYASDITDLPAWFWDGYGGNGEPFGLINMPLCQKYGRANEERHDNCQVFNPCVTGDTKILTEKGYQRIDSLVDKEVSIWNGHEWSNVKPYVTGYSRATKVIRFSDGRSVRVTDNHNFIMRDGSRLQARDLEVGMYIAKHSFPVIHGNVVLENAYERGLYCADGSANRNQIWLYGKKQLLAGRAGGRTGPASPNRCIYRTVGKGYIKNFVPSVDVRIQDKLDYLAGLIDGDGTVTKDNNIQISSIDRDFLADVQDLLSTLGVNSKLVIMHEEQERFIKTKSYLCQTTYRLLVAASGMKQLLDLGLYLSNHKVHTLNTVGDKAHFTQITSIEDGGVADVVYCFTESKNNSGIFNGIYAGNCAEQPLAPYETCCLAEIFLPNIKSKKEFWDIARILYKINKHSLTLPCHHSETADIVHKNMRMGIGITGWMQATEEQVDWCDDVYKQLRLFDKEYSKRIGVPESIRLTTTKPSGTLSLLAGVTPGVHPGYSQYHLRRVRIAADSPLVSVIRNRGYHVEPVLGFDGRPQHHTVVAEFPCKFPSHTRVARDVSAVEQLEMVKKVQTVWSDNAVSCTVYYKLEELDSIKKWLKKNYKDSIKSVSFLLHSDHGFKQAPLEEITEEEYSRLIKKVRPIHNFNGNTTDDTESLECVGGVCPIK